MAIDLDRDSYEKETNDPDKVVLVDFWGPKCGPCLALMPAVEELEKEYGDKVKVTKLNSTGNRMLCAKLRVMSLPTFIIYKKGEEVKRLSSDSFTIDEIKQALDEAIA